MNRSESGKMGGTSRAVKTAGANFKREFTPETYRAFLTNAGYPNAQYTHCEDTIPCEIAVLQKPKN